MGTKTEHYQLNQWEPTDDFLRTDFNADNLNIENALTELSGRCRIAAGAYVGDGVDNRFFNLGFTPKAVILTDENGRMHDGYRYGGIAVTGGNTTVITITESGFAVRQDFPNKMACNHTNIGYRYIALG